MADFLKWRDSWLTGIETLDTQHAELAACLNAIARTCFGEEKQDPGRTGQAEDMMTRLYDITRQHFRYEEQLMHDAEYPGYPEHVREHSMLLAELKLMIRTSFKADGGKIDGDTLKALKTWFIAHIAHSDKLFAQFNSRQREVRSQNSKNQPTPDICIQGRTARKSAPLVLADVL